MFDGVPIPRLEMQDWLSDTIRSIPVKQGDCVLEIGCGTGMVLFALEPHCQEYFGVDMFGPALAFVRARVIERGLEDKVTLFQGMAHELAQLLPREKRFDLVVINSVVQHFPSSKYLENVLKFCIDILQDGGRILLGDLRGLGVDKHHDLARVLHCDPSPELLTSEIQERLDRLQLRQTELKINPSFFFRVQNNLDSRISHIEVSPKMMVSRNELSQFRYQVILHIGTPTPTLTAPDRWVEYTTLRYLEDALSSGRNDIVAVRGIPNSLVGVEQGILQLLSLPQPPATASELVVAATVSDGYLRALSPKDIAALAERHGYQVDISIKALGVDQTMAAVFSHGSSSVKGDFSAIALDDEPTNALVDHVATPSYVQDLSVRLLDRCREKLPLYMVPHHVIIERSLPLTENGKVDRKLLAQPHMWTKSLSFGALSETYHPENEMQAQVQDCIARALNIHPAKVCTVSQLA
jgi:SAM-dependent methyltransferase